MARSNKPILWLPFAGGGLVAALDHPGADPDHRRASCRSGIVQLAV